MDWIKIKFEDVVLPFFFALLAAFFCWFAVELVYLKNPSWYNHDIHDIFIALCGVVGTLTYLKLKE